MIINSTFGGAALNFSVVGGTAQPASPGENTLWVSTSEEITGWAFSATEPTEPLEGMLWFQTAQSSPISFNALKKNKINLLPTACAQYINGAWTSKTAMLYSAAQWHGWTLYVFKDGAFTNGSYVGKAGDSMGSYGLSGKNILVKTNGATTSYLCTSVKFDTTGKKKLIFKVVSTQLSQEGYYGTTHFGISNTTGATDFVAKTSITNSTNSSTRELSVDISSYNEEYYVKICNTRSNPYCTDSVYVSEIRME